jgi:hypothetical protein
MTQTSELAKDVLKDLITIERTLWENNAEIYHDRFSPEALLIFADVGRIDRETAVAAIRKENSRALPYCINSPECVEGEFSEVRIQHSAWIAR